MTGRAGTRSAVRPTPETAPGRGGVRVAVVDPRPLFRRGVLAALAPHGDISSAGEAGDGGGALDLVQASHPHVVLLGLDLPDRTGAEVCQALRQEQPRTRVIVVAARDDDADLAGAVRAGATGYLLEDCTPDELVQAVRVVASGGSLLSPAMAGRLLDEFASLVRRSEAGEATALTRRELEVLQLMAEGLGNRAIAERLFISENTVKNHVRNVHEKLQVHSRMEAVVRAVREGLLEIA